MDSKHSNLEFRSNLQPVISGDWNVVYKAVRDPFALEILHRHHSLTPVQELQYNYASVHCAYADPDDYPWGTRCNVNGVEVAVCKCLKVKCIHFRKCRPYFDESELQILEENKKHSSTIVEFAKSRAEKYRREQKRILKEGETTTSAGVQAPIKDIPMNHKDQDRIGPDIKEKTENDDASEGNTSIQIEQTADVPSTLIKETIEGSTTAAAPEDRRIPAKASGETIIPPKSKKTGFESFVTVEQIKVINVDVCERSLINAGPGTGKTWTLIERIISLLHEKETDPESIMILCFSRAAVEVIDQRLTEAVEKGRIGYEYRKLDVRTFDSFATFVIAWIMQEHPDLLPKGYMLEGQTYEDRIRTAITIIKKSEDLLSQYEHLIIDEIQDLVGYRAEMVLEMLKILPDECGFTLLGDSCQALYDWQNNDSDEIMSSTGFYDALFTEWPSINYFKFEENHRQVGSLAKVAIPYRDEILEGTPASRNAALERILREIAESGIDIRHVKKESIYGFKQNGTLGILTRTNGQALKISELLRNADIPHVLQRPSSNSSLKPWIADVFTKYPNETINRDMFTEVYNASEKLNADDAWSALTSTQYDDGVSRYEVSSLLVGLLRNAKNKDLYITNDIDADITVSNIHRAKGREFDSVLVLEDVLKPQDDQKTWDDSQNNDIQEHKVRYVAITRPKKQLSNIKMKPQYIYIDKLTRRCFQASFSNKSNKYLTHIEVGLPGDLNNRSFAEHEKMQAFIANELKTGMRLKLIKLPKGSEAWVEYKIVLEENENICLGKTSHEFARGLKRAMQKIWSNHNDIDYKYYANTFGDIYVEDLISCVAVSTNASLAAKVFGNMSVWRGFTVSGFARFEKDTY